MRPIKILATAAGAAIISANCPITPMDISMLLAPMLVLQLQELGARPSITASFAGTQPAGPGSEMLPGVKLQTTLQAAADGGVKTFTIPPGEYNFSSSSLQLVNAAGLDITAAGVTLWFSPGGGLSLRAAPTSRSAA